jgi:hypothetical protein
MNKETLELEKTDVQVVEGEFINIKHCSIRSVDGGHIEMEKVCAVTIDGEQADVMQSAVCVARAEALNMKNCVNVLSVTGRASINSSCSLVTLAGKGIDEVNRSNVGVMVSNNIQAENTSAFIMVANNVSGNVKTFMDWRSALALGAAFGGVFGLIKILSKK